MSTGSKRLLHSGACFGPAALIVWGPGSAPGRHAHSCVQVSVALTGALRVRERARAPWRLCRAVVANANAHHEIDAVGSLHLIGFIGEHSTLGAALTARLRAPLDIVSRVETAKWRRALGDPKTLDSARVTRWLTSIVTRSDARASVDARVERVLQLLQERPLEARTTSLDQLSRAAGLSPSRFAHVFTESMGIPLRPYLRWLRLQRAARELVTGKSITQAAHVAGFADASHLTRTFRRTLGATPRDLIERTR